MDFRLKYVKQASEDFGTMLKNLSELDETTFQSTVEGNKLVTSFFDAIKTSNNLDKELDKITKLTVNKLKRKRSEEKVEEEQPILSKKGKTSSFEEKDFYKGFAELNDKYNESINEEEKSVVCKHA